MGQIYKVKKEIRYGVICPNLKNTNILGIKNEYAVYAKKDFMIGTYELLSVRTFNDKKIFRNTDEFEVMFKFEILDFFESESCLFYNNSKIELIINAEPKNKIVLFKDLELAKYFKLRANKFLYEKLKKELNELKKSFNKKELVEFEGKLLHKMV